MSSSGAVQRAGFARAAVANPATCTFSVSCRSGVKEFTVGVPDGKDIAKIVVVGRLEIKLTLKVAVLTGKRYCCGIFSMTAPRPPGFISMTPPRPPGFISMTPPRPPRGGEGDPLPRLPSYFFRRGHFTAGFFGQVNGCLMGIKLESRFAGFSDIGHWFNEFVILIFILRLIGEFGKGEVFLSNC